MSTGYSRYDGVADWYEATFSEFNGEEAEFLAETLGAGHGKNCLDVACGARPDEGIRRPRTLVPRGIRSYWLGEARLRVWRRTLEWCWRTSQNVSGVH